MRRNATGNGSAAVGQQLWCWRSGKIGAQGFVEECEDATTRPSAGGEHGPDAFEPTLPLRAARALRYLAIDHHETNRLLGEIVGRLDAGGRDETQITFAVLLEACGQVFGLAGFGHVPGDCRLQVVAG